MIPGHVLQLRYRRTGPQAGPYSHDFKPGGKIHTLEPGETFTARQRAIVLQHPRREIWGDDREPGFERYLENPFEAFQKHAFARGFRQKVVGDDAYTKSRHPHSPQLKMWSATNNQIKIYESKGKRLYWIPFDRYKENVWRVRGACVRCPRPARYVTEAGTLLCALHKKHRSKVPGLAPDDRIGYRIEKLSLKRKGVKQYRRNPMKNLWLGLAVVGGLFLLGKYRADTATSAVDPALRPSLSDWVRTRIMSAEDWEL